MRGQSFCLAVGEVQTAEDTEHALQLELSHSQIDLYIHFGTSRVF